MAQERMVSRRSPDGSIVAPRSRHGRVIDLRPQARPPARPSVVERPASSVPKPNLGTLAGTPSRTTPRSVRPRTNEAEHTPPEPKISIGQRLLGAIQYPVISIGALAAAYSPQIGQWLVLAFAVYALIFRRGSRLSFGLALFLLVTVPLFEALGQSGIAQNVAIYVYELLVLGTVQAVFEVKKFSKTDN